MVTHHRAYIFGKVVQGKIRLSEYGKIATAEWFRTSQIRVNVQVHLYETSDTSRGAATLRPYQDPYNDRQVNILPNSLRAIVRSYKSAVTYQINRLRKSPGKPIWQRNYYEHIIRGQQDLESIHKYILNNPENWVNDPEYISQI
jgi:putative transposase